MGSGSGPGVGLAGEEESAPEEGGYRYSGEWGDGWGREQREWVSQEWCQFGGGERVGWVGWESASALVGQGDAEGGSSVGEGSAATVVGDSSEHWRGGGRGSHRQDRRGGGRERGGGSLGVIGGGGGGGLRRHGLLEGLAALCNARRRAEAALATATPMTGTTCLPGRGDVVAHACGRCAAAQLT